jgi:hypothetical protein
MGKIKLLLLPIALIMIFIIMTSCQQADSSSEIIEESSAINGRVVAEATDDPITGAYVIILETSQKMEEKDEANLV